MAFFLQYPFPPVCLLLLTSKKPHGETDLPVGFFDVLMNSGRWESIPHRVHTPSHSNKACFQKACFQKNRRIGPLICRRVHVCPKCWFGSKLFAAMLIMFGLTWCFRQSIDNMIMTSSQTTTTDSRRSPSLLLYEEGARAQPLDLEATNCSNVMQRFRKGEIEATKTRKIDSKEGVKRDMNYQRSFVTVTETSKPFYVATHAKEVDAIRAHIMEYQHYYEKQLTARVVEIFEEKSAQGKESIMLDVGANIGWFSLVAAAHGATKVYSFEPNLQNVVRLCESLSLNRWLHDDMSRDVVVPIAKGASNENSKKSFYENDLTNPGSFSFKKGPAGAKALGELEVTTLDSFAERHGWFEDKPTIALMKVDVERYEPQVFEGAKRLITSKLIEKIVMELKPDQMIGKNKNAVEGMVKALFDAGYEFYMHGKFRGPSVKVQKVYDRWQDLVVDLANKTYGENVMFRLRIQFR